MQKQPSLTAILGSAAAPVYDREAMLREVLTAKLSKWLDSKTFYVTDLKKMRAIARDIQGLPEARRFEAIPPDIDRLHCMGFETLSKLSLLESVATSLEYVGVTEATGADLLGTQGWAELQQRVSALKDGPTLGAITVSPWARLSLATLASDVFAGRFFSICEVDKLASALDATRSAFGLPARASSEMTYAALNALHCKNWSDMAPAISAGLKDAVWEVCGLDDQVGPLAFGEHWERIEGLSAPTPTPQPSIEVSNSCHQISATSPTHVAGKTNVDAAPQEVEVVEDQVGERSGWLGRFVRSLLGH